MVQKWSSFSNITSQSRCFIIRGINQSFVLSWGSLNPVQFLCFSLLFVLILLWNNFSLLQVLNGKSFWTLCLISAAKCFRFLKNILFVLNNPHNFWISLTSLTYNWINVFFFCGTNVYVIYKMLFLFVVNSFNHVPPNRDWRVKITSLWNEWSCSKAPSTPCDSTISGFV